MNKKVANAGTLIVFASIIILIAFGGAPIDKTGAAGEEYDGTARMGALDDWTRARAYPFKDIPSNGYASAFLASTSSSKSLSKPDLYSPTWEPIGPMNSDARGRAISVAINPLNFNAVYCGSAGGGLWRSRHSSAGGDWERIHFGFPALSIGSIAIDPVDTNTIYVGTGEVFRYQSEEGGTPARTTRGSFGLGILKTTDAGKTWAISLDWTSNQQRAVQQIRINPLNNMTVLAATTEGIYRSLNGGSDWSLVLSVPIMTDLVYDRLDTTMVLASAGNFKSSGSGIYRSTDGGASWTFLPGGQSNYSGKARLESYYSSPNVVYASVADSNVGGGSLWRSIDFGGSWSQINTQDVPGNQGWYSHFDAVNSTDSSVNCRGGSTLYQSTDGGASFAASTGGYTSNNNYAHEPTHPYILYVVNDNGIYRSTNFGKSFVDIGMGMQTLQFNNGISSGDTDSLLVIAQVEGHIPGFIYRGNSIWSRGAYDEAGWMGVTSNGSSYMYAAGHGDVTGTKFWKSADNGVHWSNFYTPPGGFSGPSSWNTPMVVMPLTANSVYVGTAYVYKTTNGANSWTKTNGGVVLDGNPVYSMAISATSRDTLIVGTAPLVTRAHLFATTDGGTTWSDITGILPDRYPMDLAVNPKNNQTIISTFGGFGTGHVFKSYDLGATWSNIDGSLPDLPTTAVLIDPIDTNVIFVGNDLGLHVSTNGGNDWLPYNEGLPEAVFVSDLSMNASAHKLRVATHGNGVYERNVIFGQAQVNFDYRAYSLDAPANGSVDGSQIFLGSNLNPIQASFRNSGGAAQTDSFLVTYTISRAGTELYSSARQIPGLGLAEIRRVTFDGGFTPQDTGWYTIQAVCLVNDQIHSDDTLTGAIHVMVAPTIAQLSITKRACPYTEIVGGLPGPAGDDDAKRIKLPFAFAFDGDDYDSLLLSTNGWAELGKGPAGSVRGLSTTDQLGEVGANENGRLSATGHPSKTLGVWWDDLNTNIAGANVTYKTLGVFPNRVFVAQWQKMRAYYDASLTSTTVNFQLFLYETTNDIEYHYGPVDEGTFGGEDIGAMIGFKDTIGGSYHYFDIFAGKSGLESEVSTLLSPLTDWPGENTCFRIQKRERGVPVLRHAGWGLVSIPTMIDSNCVCSYQYFPGIFRYNGRYFESDSIKLGEGAWKKYATGENLFYLGSPLPTISLILGNGWNLIGSVDHDAPLPAGGHIASLAYGYDNGYYPTTIIEPGKAYWIKNAGMDTVTLGFPILSKEPVEEFNAYDSFTFTNGSGGEQKLFLAEHPRHASFPDFYSMPPGPPGGFDVRYSSQRVLEVIGAEKKYEFPIDIRSEDYPVRMAWHFAPGSKSVKLYAGGKIHPLGGSGSTLIPESQSRIIITIDNGQSSPKEFLLEQNYPNPFNPTTVIRYQLPSDSHVLLKVYNLGGQEVITLIDRFEEAGYRTAEFDARAFPSGLYFYRVKAGGFTGVKKMVLVK